MVAQPGRSRQSHGTGRTDSADNGSPAVHKGVLWCRWFTRGIFARLAARQARGGNRGVRISTLLHIRLDGGFLYVRTDAVMTSVS